MKLRFCRGGTSLAVSSQQGNPIPLSQGVTGAWKSGRFHKQKRSAVCTDVLMSLVQFPSARAAPTPPHTQPGGVRVRTFLWKYLQEGKTHLEGFTSGYPLPLGEVI